MATPAGPGPSDAKHGDRRRSLSKYVKRMSSVFRRERPSKAAASSPLPALAGPHPDQQPPPSLPRPLPSALPPSPTKQTDPAEQQAAPAAPSSPALPVTAPSTALAKTTQIDRHTMQQERARALFAKYGLTLEAHEWITTPAVTSNIQRVEKSIRMRVHRSCHRCGTIYGSDKVCLSCEHKRCKKCPRYPRKKSSGETDKGKEKEIAEKPGRKKNLTITSKSGNELAYQPPKQRIRRTCHKCESLFTPPTATTCDQCQHVRCTKCPREPAKLTKWPVGYPGDVDADSDSEVENVEKQLDRFRRTWRKPRSRVRWECEKCHSSFLNKSPQCPGCGHERCDRCTRSPVKKAKKIEQFDPQIVAAVEAKLRALGVDDDSSTTGAVAM